MKKSMFIFLDLDGVLNNNRYVNQVLKTEKVKVIKEFDRQNILAFNYLLANLRLNYKVNICITSQWRQNMKFTIDALNNFGVMYKKQYYKTDNLGDRANEIEKFIQDKKVQNFIVIDDEKINLKDKYKNYQIKTSFETGLTPKDINNFLKGYEVNNEKFYQ